MHSYFIMNNFSLRLYVYLLSTIYLSIFTNCLFIINCQVDISKLNGVRININENKSQPVEINNSSSSSNKGKSGSNNSNSSGINNNNTNLVMYRDLDSNAILRPIVIDNKKKTFVGPDFIKTFVVAHDFMAQLGLKAATAASIEEKKEGLPVSFKIILYVT